MKLMQWKPQIEFPDVPESHNLVSDASARKSKAPTNFAVGPSGQRGGRLNRLPPGSDSGKPDLPFSMADKSDAAATWNAASVRDGYKRLPNPSGNDVPLDFYSDAVADGQHGFAERLNVKDRI